MSTPDAADVAVRWIGIADAAALLAKSGGVQVHSLVVTAADSPINPHLRKLCEGSGGTIVRLAVVNDVAIWI